MEEIIKAKAKKMNDMRHEIANLRTKMIQDQIDLDNRLQQIQNELNEAIDIIENGGEK